MHPVLSVDKFDNRHAGLGERPHTFHAGLHEQNSQLIHNLALDILPYAETQLILV